jgi:hypothetical protein
MLKIGHANQQNIHPTQTFCGKDIFAGLDPAAEVSMSVPSLGPMERHLITCLECRMFVDGRWPLDVHGFVQVIPRSSLSGAQRVPPHQLLTSPQSR